MAKGNRTPVPPLKALQERRQTEERRQELVERPADPSVAPVTRISAHLNDELLEQFRDYCYWNRVTHQVVLERLLRQELQQNPPPGPRPDHARKRKRGRKRKED